MANSKADGCCAARDAWNAQSGLSKTEAKRLYIATLIEVCGPFSFSSSPGQRSTFSTS